MSRTPGHTQEQYEINRKRYSAVSRYIKNVPFGSKKYKQAARLINRLYRLTHNAVVDIIILLTIGSFKIK